MKNSLDGNVGGGVDRVSAARKERAELDKLGDDIAELSARIQAAMYQLLVMIAEFDRREGWDGGFLSCAHWLNWRTGLALGTAREWVRVARALTELPLISKAMSQGQISYSKVRALTRVATPKNEERLLDFALAGNASHVEKLCRAWRRVDRIAEAEQDERRLASRSLVLYDDEDGMVVVRGRLDPETGAVCAAPSTPPPTSCSATPARPSKTPLMHSRRKSSPSLPAPPAARSPSSIAASTPWRSSPSAPWPPSSTPAHPPTATRSSSTSMPTSCATSSRTRAPPAMAPTDTVAASQQLTIPTLPTASL